MYAFEPSRRAAAALGPGVRDQPGDVFGLDRHVAHTRLARGAGVARGDVDLGDARRLRDLPRQRVFATAAADDQDAHQCRKWRMPVNTIARPCSSAAAITSGSRFEPPGWITAVMP